MSWHPNVKWREVYESQSPGGTGVTPAPTRDRNSFRSYVAV